MPREIAHWNVLKRAKDEAAKRSLKNVANCLEKNWHAALLGAMLHDAPYYYRFGGNQFEEIANSLHGLNGEDTMTILRKVAKSISNENFTNPSAAFAFLLGMLSHAATDISFHPLVFYLTGNYHDPDAIKQKRAQARHRLFETYLDSFMRIKFREASYPLLYQLANNTKADLSEYCALLDNLCSDKDAGKKYFAAVRYMSYLQRLFLSNVCGLLIRFLNKITAGALAGIDSLFYFGRKIPLSIFESEITYLNPSTGEKAAHSIEELLEESVKLSVKFFEFVEVDSSASKEFDKFVGPSLNLGIVGANSADARYFVDEENVLPELKVIK